MRSDIAVYLGFAFVVMTFISLATPTVVILDVIDTRCCCFPSEKEHEIVKNESNMDLHGLATRVARKYGIDSTLFHALVTHESAWRSNAVSPKGAIGLTQVMPMTGKGFCGLSREELFDTAKNLDCGARYLKAQLQRFGDTRLALAAYNAGPERVARFGGIPPFAETRAYVSTIMEKI